jgi:Uma2 family endonuclease
VLAGTLLVTPSPGSAHQGVAVRLTALFATHILGRRLVLFSPGVVTLPPLTQLEPDLLVVPPRFVPGTSWAEIAEHWLAVEIVSRSSRVYDREFKRDAYLALGVREVWLVDVRDRSIEVCVRRGAGRIFRDAIRWSAPDSDVSVDVDLTELFADIV